MNTAQTIRQKHALDFIHLKMNGKNVKKQENEKREKKNNFNKIRPFRGDWIKIKFRVLKKTPIWDLLGR